MSHASAVVKLDGFTKFVEGRQTDNIFNLTTETFGDFEPGDYLFLYFGDETINEVDGDPYAFGAYGYELSFNSGEKINGRNELKLNLKTEVMQSVSYEYFTPEYTKRQTEFNIDRISASFIRKRHPEFDFDNFVSFLESKKLTNSAFKENASYYGVNLDEFINVDIDDPFLRDENNAQEKAYREQIRANLFMVGLSPEVLDIRGIREIKINLEDIQDIRFLEILYNFKPSNLRNDRVFDTDGFVTFLSEEFLHPFEIEDILNTYVIPINRNILNFELDDMRCWVSKSYIKTGWINSGVIKGGMMGIIDPDLGPQHISREGGYEFDALEKNIWFNSETGDAKVEKTTFLGGVWYRGDWEKDQSITYDTAETEQLLIAQDREQRLEAFIGTDVYPYHPSNFRSGLWFNDDTRRFFDGGRWFQGEWYNGTFIDGYFKGGNWFFGEMQGGRMDSSFRFSTWYDGINDGGKLNNVLWWDGRWRDGEFGDKEFNGVENYYDRDAIENTAVGAIDVMSRVSSFTSYEQLDGGAIRTDRNGRNRIFSELQDHVVFKVSKDLWDDIDNFNNPDAFPSRRLFALYFVGYLQNAEWKECRKFAEYFINFFLNFRLFEIIGKFTTPDVFGVRNYYLITDFRYGSIDLDFFDKLDLSQTILSRNIFMRGIFQDGTFNHGVFQGNAQIRNSDVQTGDLVSQTHNKQFYYRENGRLTNKSRKYKFDIKGYLDYYLGDDNELTPDIIKNFEFDNKTLEDYLFDREAFRKDLEISIERSDRIFGSNDLYLVLDDDNDLTIDDNLIEEHLFWNLDDRYSTLWTALGARGFIADIDSGYSFFNGGTLYNGFSSWQEDINPIAFKNLNVIRQDGNLEDLNLKPIKGISIVDKYLRIEFDIDDPTDTINGLSVEDPRDSSVFAYLGYWEDGTFNSGVFNDTIWKDGNKDSIIKIGTNDEYRNDYMSIMIDARWYEGTHRGGYIGGGIWHTGRFEAGVLDTGYTLEHYNVRNRDLKVFPWYKKELDFKSGVIGNPDRILEHKAYIKNGVIRKAEIYDAVYVNGSLLQINWHNGDWINSDSCYYDRVYRNGHDETTFTTPRPLDILNYNDDNLIFTFSEPHRFQKDSRVIIYSHPKFDNQGTRITSLRHHQQLMRVKEVISDYKVVLYNIYPEEYYTLFLEWDEYFHVSQRAFATSPEREFSYDYGNWYNGEFNRNIALNEEGQINNSYMAREWTGSFVYGTWHDGTWWDGSYSPMQLNRQVKEFYGLYNVSDVFVRGGIINIWKKGYWIKGHWHNGKAMGGTFEQLIFAKGWMAPEVDNLIVRGTYYESRYGKELNYFFLDPMNMLEIYEMYPEEEIVESARRYIYDFQEDTVGQDTLFNDANGFKFVFNSNGQFNHYDVSFDLPTDKKTILIASENETGFDEVLFENLNDGNEYDVLYLNQEDIIPNFNNYEKRIPTGFLNIDVQIRNRDIDIEDYPHMLIDGPSFHHSIKGMNNEIEDFETWRHYFQEGDYFALGDVFNTQDVNIQRIISETIDGKEYAVLVISEEEEYVKAKNIFDVDGRIRTERVKKKITELDVDGNGNPVIIREEREEDRMVYYYDNYFYLSGYLETKERNDLHKIFTHYKDVRVEDRDNQILIYTGKPLEYFEIFDFESPILKVIKNGVAQLEHASQKEVDVFDLKIYHSHPNGGKFLDVTHNKDYLDYYHSKISYLDTDSEFRMLDWDDSSFASNKIIGIEEIPLSPYDTTIEKAYNYGYSGFIFKSVRAFNNAYVSYSFLENTESVINSDIWNSIIDSLNNLSSSGINRTHIFQRDEYGYFRENEYTNVTGRNYINAPRTETNFYGVEGVDTNSYRIVEAIVSSDDGGGRVSPDRRSTFSVIISTKNTTPYKKANITGDFNTAFRRGDLISLIGMQGEGARLAGGNIPRLYRIERVTLRKGDEIRIQVKNPFDKHYFNFIDKSVNLVYDINGAANFYKVFHPNIEYYYNLDGEVDGLREDYRGLTHFGNHAKIISMAHASCGSTLNFHMRGSGSINKVSGINNLSHIDEAGFDGDISNIYDPSEPYRVAYTTYNNVVNDILRYTKIFRLDDYLSEAIGIDIDVDEIFGTEYINSLRLEEDFEFEDVIQYDFRALWSNYNPVNVLLDKFNINRLYKVDWMLEKISAAYFDNIKQRWIADFKIHYGIVYDHRNKVKAARIEDILVPPKETIIRNAEIFRGEQFGEEFISLFINTRGTDFNLVSHKNIPDFAGYMSSFAEGDVFKFKRISYPDPPEETIINEVNSELYIEKDILELPNITYKEEIVNDLRARAFINPDIDGGENIWIENFIDFNFNFRDDNEVGNLKTNPTDYLQEQLKFNSLVYLRINNDQTDGYYRIKYVPIFFPSDPLQRTPDEQDIIEKFDITDFDIAYYIFDEHAIPSDNFNRLILTPINDFNVPDFEFYIDDDKENYLIIHTPHHSRVTGFATQSSAMVGNNRLNIKTEHTFINRQVNYNFDAWTIQEDAILSNSEVGKSIIWGGTSKNNHYGGWLYDLNESKSVDIRLFFDEERLSTSDHNFDLIMKGLKSEDDTFYSGIWNGGYAKNCRTARGFLPRGVQVFSRYNLNRPNQPRLPALKFVWLRGIWEGGHFEEGRWFSLRDSYTESTHGTYQHEASIFLEGEWGYKLEEETLIQRKVYHTLEFPEYVGSRPLISDFSEEVYNIEFLDYVYNNAPPNWELKDSRGVFRRITTGTYFQDYLTEWFGGIWNPEMRKVTLEAEEGEEVDELYTYGITKNFSEDTTAREQRQEIKKKEYYIDINAKANWYSGTWYRGTWFGGAFQGGHWYNIIDPVQEMVRPKNFDIFDLLDRIPQIPGLEQLEELKRRLEEILRRLEELSRGIDLVLDEIRGIDLRLGSIAQILQKIGFDFGLGGLNATDLLTLNERKANAEQEQSNLQSQKSNFESELESLRSELTDLQNEESDIRDQIAQLKKDNPSVDQENSNNEFELAEKTIQLKENTEQLNAYNEEIERLNSDISSLQQQRDLVQSDLNNTGLPVEERRRLTDNLTDLSARLINLEDSRDRNQNLVDNILGENSILEGDIFDLGEILGIPDINIRIDNRDIFEFLFRIIAPIFPRQTNLGSWIDRPDFILTRMDYLTRQDIPVDSPLTWRFRNRRTFAQASYFYDGSFTNGHWHGGVFGSYSMYDSWRDKTIDPYLTTYFQEYTYVTAPHEELRRDNEIYNIGNDYYFKFRYAPLNPDWRAVVFGTKWDENMAYNRVLGTNYGDDDFYNENRFNQNPSEPGEKETIFFGKSFYPFEPVRGEISSIWYRGLFNNGMTLYAIFDARDDKGRLEIERTEFNAGFFYRSIWRAGVVKTNFDVDNEPIFADLVDAARASTVVPADLTTEEEEQLIYDAAKEMWNMVVPFGTETTHFYQSVWMTGIFTKGVMEHSMWFSGKWNTGTFKHGIWNSAYYRQWFLYYFPNKRFENYYEPSAIGLPNTLDNKLILFYTLNHYLVDEVGAREAYNDAHQRLPLDLKINRFRTFDFNTMQLFPVSITGESDYDMNYTHDYMMYDKDPIKPDGMNVDNKVMPFPSILGALASKDMYYNRQEDRRGPLLHVRIFEDDQTPHWYSPWHPYLKNRFACVQMGITDTKGMYQKEYSKGLIEDSVRDEGVVEDVNGIFTNTQKALILPFGDGEVLHNYPFVTNLTDIGRKLSPGEDFRTFSYLHNYHGQAEQMQPNDFAPDPPNPTINERRGINKLWDSADYFRFSGGIDNYASYWGDGEFIGSNWNGGTWKFGNFGFKDEDKDTEFHYSGNYLVNDYVEEGERVEGELQEDRAIEAYQNVTFDYRSIWSRGLWLGGFFSKPEWRSAGSIEPLEYFRRPKSTLGTPINVTVGPDGCEAVENERNDNPVLNQVKIPAYWEKSIFLSMAAPPGEILERGVQHLLDPNSRSGINCIFENEFNLFHMKRFKEHNKNYYAYDNYNLSKRLDPQTWKKKYRIWSYASWFKKIDARIHSEFNGVFISGMFDDSYKAYDINSNGSVNFYHAGKFGNPEQANLAPTQRQWLPQPLGPISVDNDSYSIGPSSQYVVHESTHPVYIHTERRGVTSNYTDPFNPGYFDPFTTSNTSYALQWNMSMNYAKVPFLSPIAEFGNSPTFYDYWRGRYNINWPERVPYLMGACYDLRDPCFRKLQYLYRVYPTPKNTSIVVDQEKKIEFEEEEGREEVYVTGIKVLPYKIGDGGTEELELQYAPQNWMILGMNESIHNMKDTFRIDNSLSDLALGILWDRMHKMLSVDDVYNHWELSFPRYKSEDVGIFSVKQGPNGEPHEKESYELLCNGFNYWVSYLDEDYENVLNRDIHTDNLMDERERLRRNNMHFNDKNFIYNNRAIVLSHNFYFFNSGLGPGDGEWYTPYFYYDPEEYNNAITQYRRAEVVYRERLEERDRLIQEQREQYERILAEFERRQNATSGQTLTQTAASSDANEVPDDRDVTPSTLSIDPDLSQCVPIDWDIYIQELLRFEGGRSSSTADAAYNGGAGLSPRGIHTNHGIIWTTFKANARRVFGLTDENEMAYFHYNMSQAQASEFAMEMYINKYRVTDCDAINVIIIEAFWGGDPYNKLRSAFSKYGRDIKLTEPGYVQGIVDEVGPVQFWQDLHQSVWTYAKDANAPGGQYGSTPCGKRAFGWMNRIEKTHWLFTPDGNKNYIWYDYYDEIEDFRSADFGSCDRNVDLIVNYRKNTLKLKKPGSASSSEHIVRNEFNLVTENESILNIIEDPNLVIEEYLFEDGNYHKEQYKKDYIVIHHTARNYNPYHQKEEWEKDPRKIGTAYLIGRLDSYNLGNDTFDGMIVRLFDDSYWAEHTGLGEYYDSKSIGIEICSYGPLDNSGKPYNKDAQIPRSQIEDLITPYRGYHLYEKYTPAQIDSLTKLIMYLCKKHHIPFENSHIKNYDWEWADTKLKDFDNLQGIFNHGNFDEARAEIYPNKRMLSNLETLSILDLNEFEFERGLMSRELMMPDDKTIPQAGECNDSWQDIVITDKFLTEAKIFKGELPKRQIVLHHTAGNCNPNWGAFNSWNQIGKKWQYHTPFVIGGSSSNINENCDDFEGKIYRYYDEMDYGYHSSSGSDSNGPRDRYKIGIEVCNWGNVTKRGNKFYTYAGHEIDEQYVIDLGFEFRGYRYFENYSDEVIESLRKLISYLSDKYDIPIKPGNLDSFSYEDGWFDYNKEALQGEPGIWNHVNSKAKGKWDLYPHPKLIDMLNCLGGFESAAGSNVAPSPPANDDGENNVGKGFNTPIPPPPEPPPAPLPPPPPPPEPQPVPFTWGYQNWPDEINTNETADLSKSLIMNTFGDFAYPPFFGTGSYNFGWYYYPYMRDDGVNIRYNAPYFFTGFSNVPGSGTAVGYSLRNPFDGSAELIHSTYLDIFDLDVRPMGCTDDSVNQTGQGSCFYDFQLKYLFPYDLGQHYYALSDTGFAGLEVDLFVSPLTSFRQFVPIDTPLDPHNVVIPNLDLPQSEFNIAVILYTGNELEYELDTERSFLSIEPIVNEDNVFWNDDRRSFVENWELLRAEFDNEILENFYTVERMQRIDMESSWRNAGVFGRKVYFFRASALNLTNLTYVTGRTITIPLIVKLYFKKTINPAIGARFNKDFVVFKKLNLQIANLNIDI